MRNRLLGLAIVALMSAPSFAQDDCCNTCSEPGCSQSWHVVGGIEALFLRPRLNNGDAFIVSSVTQDDRVRSFDFDYETAPRLTVGLENCKGLGARVRYFYIDADAFESQIVDLGLNDRVSRTITDGVFITDVDAAGVLDDGVTVATDLKLQTLDLEMTQRLNLGKSTVNVSGGIRWAQVESRLAASEFDNVGVLNDAYFVGAKFSGWGATIAASLDRQLGCSGLSLLANTRASAIMGKSDVGVIDPLFGGDYLLADRYSGMFIGEVQVGAKYACTLSNGSVASVQATYEGQYWGGMPLATRMGDNFSDSDDLFLDGFGFGLGLNF
jgi:hypothetical protein